MPTSFPCTICGQLFEPPAAGVVQCPVCATRRAAAPGTPQYVAPAAPMPLSYAPVAATSREERRFRLTAIWCGIAAALWMIAFALRQLLNSVCGIPDASGEFAFHHTDFTQSLFVLSLVGDLVALAASFVLAAALGRIRNGNQQWILWARAMVWVVLGNMALGLAFLGILIANQQDISITMGIMDVFGIPALAFAIVALVSLYRLRRLPADFLWRNPPATGRHWAAAYACFGMAGLHLLHSVIILAFLLSDNTTFSLWMALPSGIPLVIGIGYLLLGFWLYRNGYGAKTFALGLCGLEALASMFMLFPMIGQVRYMTTAMATYVVLLLLTLAGASVVLTFVIRAMRTPIYGTAS